MKRGVLVRLLAVTLLATACSPEASRSRNSGPGADIGNHSRNLPESSTAPKVEARP
jgi:hypothetical protein